MLDKEVSSGQKAVHNSQRLDHSGDFWINLPNNLKLFHPPAFFPINVISTFINDDRIVW